MAIVIPDVGKTLLMHYLFVGNGGGMIGPGFDANQVFLNNPLFQVRLFATNIGPGPGTVIGDFVETAFGGYPAGGAVIAGPPVITGAPPAGHHKATWSPVTFSCDGSATDDVWGYYVVFNDMAGGQEVVWCEQFAGGTTIGAAGENITFSPVFRLKIDPGFNIFIPDEGEELMLYRLFSITGVIAFSTGALNGNTIEMHLLKNSVAPVAGTTYAADVVANDADYTGVTTPALDVGNPTVEAIDGEPSQPYTWPDLVFQRDAGLLPNNNIYNYAVVARDWANNMRILWMELLPGGPYSMTIPLATLTITPKLHLAQE